LALNRDTIVCAGSGNRLGRLPFVLLIMMGLLVSLIHCAGCGAAIAQAGDAAWSASHDQGGSRDQPEQQSPCHSGHCLSHVTAQHLDAVATPVDLFLCAPSFGQEQSPAALAGLPPFKPPRA
jgi:hypothetical protein